MTRRDKRPGLIILRTRTHSIHTLTHTHAHKHTHIQYTLSLSTHNMDSIHTFPYAALPAYLGSILSEAWRRVARFQEEVWGEGVGAERVLMCFTASPLVRFSECGAGGAY